MIIFYVIPGNVLLLLAAAMFIGSIAFAIWHAIMQAKEESENTTPKELTPVKRFTIAVGVLAIFASIAATALAFTTNDGIIGAISILTWIAASLLVAYACSPLRVFAVSDGGSQQGCAFILYSPLLIIMSTVSMILIMLTSWIFGLIAVLKGLKKRTFLVIGICIALLLGIGSAANYFQREEAAQQVEYSLELAELAAEKAIDAIDSNVLTKVTFDDETIGALKHFYGTGSVFYLNDVRQAIAGKFAQLYRDGDIDGLMNYFAFLDINNATAMLAKDGTYDICFTSEYITSLIYYIEDFGTYVRDSGSSRIYSYEGHEFWLSSNFYVKLNYTFEGENKQAILLLGDPLHRETEHEQNEENSQGYFLVDETVKFVESVIQNKAG